MSVKWTFTDPSMATPDTFTFHCNPKGDSPVYQKNITFTALLESGAAPLLWEGQDQATTFSVTGSILLEEQYVGFLYWYNKRHPFVLTDDTSRQRWVYLTNFSPVRKLSRLYPWRHDYTLSGYHLGEVLPTTDPAEADWPLYAGKLPTLIQDLTAQAAAEQSAGTVL